MDAPKCKLCGEKHYGLCPSFKATPDPKAGDARKHTGQQGPAIEHPTGSGHAESNGRKDIHRRSGSSGERSEHPERQDVQGFDRVAYQREYMKGWRARKKAEK